MWINVTACEMFTLLWDIVFMKDNCNNYLDYNSYHYMKKVASGTHLMHINMSQALVVGGKEIEINQSFFFCKIRL